MLAVLFVVLVALVVSVGLIVLLMPMLRRHALAHPNARSSHKVPTPQGGGIAVVGSTIAVSVISAIGFPQFGSGLIGELVPVLAATAVVAIVGTLDDLHSISVAPRLAAQSCAAVLAIALLPPDMRLAPVLPLWSERLFLILGLVWFVNLFNFMDGIDWMTVAEAAPITAALAMVGTWGVLPPAATLLALALFGALLGFAPFNRPVARLFLGDVGSLPIGLMIGWLLVVLATSGHVAAAVLLPLYYLADATVTLVRRLAAGERVWEAHRTHFYQQATDRGRPVLEVVGKVFIVNIVLASLALFSVLVASPAIDAAALVIGAGFVIGLLFHFAGAKR